MNWDDEVNIAVCIKHVPVSNNVSIDPKTHALIRENEEGMVNPADLNALEEAITLKEAFGGQVSVFTMGPETAQKSLRTALSMGCEEAYLLTDRAFAGGDTLATAKVLAEALRQYGPFELILTGSMTSDGATGQVGPMIAQFLSIPHISEAQSIHYAPNEGSSIQVRKKCYDGEVLLKTSIPAVVTVSFGANKPRLTTLRSQRAAKSKPLHIISNKELGLNPGEIGMEGSPTQVIDSYEPPKKQTAVQLLGSDKEIAEQIMELIKKEKGNC